MKRIICLFLTFTIVLSFSSCKKEIEKSDFTAFAKECFAENYYDTCNSFLDEANCKYYYDVDNDFIFTTRTMALVYSCNAEEFEQIKNNISESFDTYTIAEDAEISEKIYEIYYVDDEENRHYSKYQEFGFIALSKDKNEIRFYWFYDQDYDGSVFSKTSFEEFYGLWFDWM